MRWLALWLVGGVAWLQGGLCGCAAENLTIGLLETPFLRICLRWLRGRSRAVARARSQPGRLDRVFRGLSNAGALVCFRGLVAPRGGCGFLTKVLQDLITFVSLICSACIFVYKRRVAYFYREDIFDVLVVEPVSSYTTALDSVLNLENLVLKVLELTLYPFNGFYSLI